MSNKSRAVLVTGAAGGVGVATTRALLKAGFRVYAGIHSHTGDLPESPDVHVLKLDLTDPESIAAAVAAVRANGDNGLAGVVNNAGVIVQGPMELVPAEELQRQFEVNVYGPALVTRAFLPHLRRGKGRVVNITASTARVPGPFFGPISASKAALQALSDAQRVELAHWKIPVVVLEPGALQTEIFVKADAASQRAAAVQSPELVALYRDQLAAVGKAMAKIKPSSPTILADAIVKALTVGKPKPRYNVGPDTRLVGLVSRLPLRTRDRMISGVMGLNKIKPAA
ncbi:SDR family NAD(P)-dependent oxidoreductase [Kitasatospora sp. LaBMicrA B282]|uniref:SDR family NAD(P)-dependent oxidoreductase n=1 Tax=Kitasatospora sp. LaBMicrA B282 TaxID=3420949 RepID=UPI003D0C6848